MRGFHAIVGVAAGLIGSGGATLAFLLAGEVRPEWWPAAAVALGSGFASAVLAVRARASRAASALHHTALLQGVAEGTTDAIFVKDAEGRYLLINRAGAEFLGRSVSDVIGQRDEKLYSQETSGEIKKSDWNILTTGKPRTSEEVRTRDGVSRVYSTTRAPYRDAQGNVVGVIGIARDITERKEAEDLVRRQTEALTRSLNLLASETALEPLIVHVLRAFRQELRASSASLYLRDAESGRLQPETSEETRRIRRNDPGKAPNGSSTAPIHEGDRALKWVYANRAPLVVEDVPQNPLVGAELRDWCARNDLRTLLVVPLLWAQQVIGVFTVFISDRRTLKSEEQEMAQALAHQATLAIQLTRLADQRQQSALLEERNRMAREIHDTLAQGFTGIIFQLEAAEEVMGDDPREAGEHVSRSLRQARESLAEARRSVWDLRPESSHAGGLREELRRLVDRNAGVAETRVELSIDGTTRPLPPQVESNLLKIAQEALTNAFKHARARNVHIELAYGDRETRLSVSDDGRGFSPERPPTAGGFGLRLMRERAQFFQGRFEVVSRPGQGTRIAVTVDAPAEVPRAAP